MFKALGNSLYITLPFAYVTKKYYLKDCALLYENRDEQRRMWVTSGAASGFIPVSDLWNVSYDECMMNHVWLDVWMVLQH